MTKEVKTAEELVKLVTQELGTADVGITVLWDKVFDWNAYAMTIPAGASDVHPKIQRIVEILRKQYTMEQPR